MTQQQLSLLEDKLTSLKSTNVGHLVSKLNRRVHKLERSVSELQHNLVQIEHYTNEFVTGLEKKINASLSALPTASQVDLNNAAIRRRKKRQKTKRRKRKRKGTRKKS